MLRSFEIWRGEGINIFFEGFPMFRLLHACCPYWVSLFVSSKIHEGNSEIVSEIEGDRLEELK